MNRLIILSIFLLLISIGLNAQVQPDTIARPPTADRQLPAEIPDSIAKNPHRESAWSLPEGMDPTPGNIYQQINARHPYFGFSAEEVNVPSDIRIFHGKEIFFYLLLLLVLVYAFLRLNFPKYFNDLFSLFFRTTLKQKQIREQLVQTPLPSLLLNGFFVVCGGMYVSFVLQHYDLNPLNNFWLMGLYAGIGLGAIYFIKFLGLKLTGWVFDMPEAANAYIFIVFVINKMLGLFLLPFLILLAFAQGNLYPIALTLSFCVVGALLIYRFILSYAAIRNQVKVNPFHFFLYLIAFEVAPLLLIYKGLLLFFRITA